MAVKINLAKAKIKDQNGNYRAIDAFSDQAQEVIDNAKANALDAIGEDNDHGARKEAISAIN